MRLEKVEIFVDDRLTIWTRENDIPSLKINETQKIRITIFIGGAEEIIKTPSLYVEDHPIQLRQDEFINPKDNRVAVFSSSAERIFRESFGLAFVRIYVADEEFALPFEVLATKVTALQAEGMIRYLTERREHIIRLCLSRTMRPAGMKDDGLSDPEMVLSTAEKIISTILECQTELRQNIRNRLIPAKVPAWKAARSGSLIDPVDVIFNLDCLRPGDGRQDVILRGRTYSTSAIDVTALIKDNNVEENAILIGGLYSIRRVISWLMDEIDTAFKRREISVYDKEYVSLKEMLFNLTGGAMHQRCERVIASTESLIKMLENDFEMKFSGEMHPKITPYVRSSRLYRNIFEQYQTWYALGSPSIDGELFLIKLRSLSKIFEFFVLFRIFDYFSDRDWKIADFLLNEEFENLIPNVITFKKDETQIKLSYEPDIFKFSYQTQHMDLIKLDHFEHPGKCWRPDYTMRIENSTNGLVRHLVLDAKYSNPYWVQNSHIINLYDKYYDHMAVFDKSVGFISRNEIMGVFAIFPEALDQAPQIVNMRRAKFGIDSRGPVIVPMVAGLPISLNTNNLMEKWLDKILEATMLSINFQGHRMHA